VKVLTHRSRYIEPAVVPEFGEGTSSGAEARQAASIVQSTEEPIVVPKVSIVGSVEAKDDKAEGPQVKNARNPEPTGRGRFVEDVKSSCRNSQEEEDGQRARGYYGDYKGLDPCSY
jgi:hypothetical protein